eukprot:6484861-Amphidinium_carterae.1
MMPLQKRPRQFCASGPLAKGPFYESPTLQWHMNARERVWKQLLSTWRGAYTPNLPTTISQ